PVKNGWHAEQISTWIVGTVERVSMTLPQAQMMDAFSYRGCMPSFMRGGYLNIGVGGGQRGAGDGREGRPTGAAIFPSRRRNQAPARRPSDGARPGEPGAAPTRRSAGWPRMDRRPSSW